MRRTLIGLGVAVLLAGCGASDGIVPTAVPTVAPTLAVPDPATAIPTSDTGGAVDPAPVNPACAGVPQYSAAPAMTIDPTKEYIATIKTAKGDIVIQLRPDNAPIAVNSFVFLAREGYYNGVTFHRVIPGFVAQGGDPSGTGTCGPGYEFEDEYNPASGLNYSQAGVLGMANAGPNTNGSQFFITYGDAGLPAEQYSIFGQVIEGMDVVNQITPRDPSLDPSAAPGDAIQTIEITEK